MVAITGYILALFRSENRERTTTVKLIQSDAPLLGSPLFLANRGILAGDKWWQFLIARVDIVVIIDSLVRYQKASAREIRIGRLIVPIILIGFGIAFLVGKVTYWALVIVLLGVAVIVGRLLRRNRNRAR